MLVVLSRTKTDTLNKEFSQYGYVCPYFEWQYICYQKNYYLEKGFELNTYPEGKYFEFVTKDDKVIEKILGKDYTGDEETAILQLKEDCSNKIICIDSNVWDLTNEQFMGILKTL